MLLYPPDDDLIEVEVAEPKLSFWEYLQKQKNKC